MACRKGGSGQEYKGMRICDECHKMLATEWYTLFDKEPGKFPLTEPVPTWYPSKSWQFSSLSCIEQFARKQQSGATS
jgi:hypothetical protein